MCNIWGFCITWERHIFHVQLSYLSTVPRWFQSCVCIHIFISNLKVCPWNTWTNRFHPKSTFTGIQSFKHDTGERTFGMKCIRPLISYPRLRSHYIPPFNLHLNILNGQRFFYFCHIHPKSVCSLWPACKQCSYC